MQRVELKVHPSLRPISISSLESQTSFILDVVVVDCLQKGCFQPLLYPYPLQYDFAAIPSKCRVYFSSPWNWANLMTYLAKRMQCTVPGLRNAVYPCFLCTLPLPGKLPGLASWRMRHNIQQKWITPVLSTFHHPTSSRPSDWLEMQELVQPRSARSTQVSKIA